MNTTFRVEGATETLRARRFQDARSIVGIGPEWKIDSVKDSGKSILVRLLNDRGFAMYAKSSEVGSARIEQAAYRALSRTPHTPIAPRYHGSIETGQFGWLFVDEAAGYELERDSPSHAARAAAWLARLHEVSSPAHNTAWGVPQRSLDHYRDRAFGLMAALAGRGSERNGGAERAIDAMARSLARLLECWSTIEAICANVPEFAVHGDLGTENMRIDETRGQVEVFDWEDAHLGVPAIDLARVSRADYVRHAAHLWPPSAVSEIEGVQSVGRVFRTIRHRIERKSLEKIAEYADRLQRDLVRLERV